MYRHSFLAKKFLSLLTFSVKITSFLWLFSNLFLKLRNFSASKFPTFSFKSFWKTKKNLKVKTINEIKKNPKKKPFNSWITSFNFESEEEICWSKFVSHRKLLVHWSILYRKKFFCCWKHKTLSQKQNENGFYKLLRVA